MMIRRKVLPSRRAHETFDFSFRGQRYTAGIGTYPDGRVAEVFIDSVKAASDASGDARDAAVTLSIALQFGTPLEAIQGALTRLENGEPTGLLGKLIDEMVGHRIVDDRLMMAVGAE